MKLLVRIALVAICLAVASSVAQAQAISSGFAYSRAANGTPVIGGLAVAKPAVRTLRESRSAAFDELIDQHARANGLHPALVRAVIETESAFNPRAVSRVGAMGLMQLMPGTARELGVTDPFDPSDNIRGGTTYLRSLLDRFDGNVEFALAAYNAGPGAVERYDGVPPYRETRNYVAKLATRIKDIRAFTRGGHTFYSYVEVMADGREVTKYTDKKPEAAHAVVELRAR